MSQIVDNVLYTLLYKMYAARVQSTRSLLASPPCSAVSVTTLMLRVTWGMTAPGGKTAPLPVDNLKLPRTFSEYTEWCYHLTDTCFERSTPRSRRKLKYSILNIYTCFDVIFHHHYTSHNYLYIGDNKERNI